MSSPTARVLDWRPRYDERSRGYGMAPADAGLPATGVLFRHTLLLDQGQEGACVLCALTHEAAAYPYPVPGLTLDYALGAYREAQRRDPWPGEAYAGTSVLAGCLTMRDRGHYSGFRWAFSPEQLAHGLVVREKGRQRGPAAVGVQWREGSYQTDHLGLLRPSGNVVGGHCLCFLGFVPADPDELLRLQLERVGLWNAVVSLRGEPCFVVLNSWGEVFGQRGLCIVPLSVAREWCATGWEAAQPEGRTGRKPRKVAA